jgi:RNA ligase (TIGR02306 family)
MSEFHVETVRIGPIAKHPNADNLSITRVRDYPVIVRTGEFSEGDLAVYVPVDSVVPAGEPRWAFLGEHRRIVAKRLRGIFSMGLLTAAPPGVSEPGVDVRAQLGITKFEPAEAPVEGEDETDPGFFPAFTDVEAVRRFPDVIREGEQVILTEKVHGANARYLFEGGRLWAGSHTRIKRRDPKNLWWKPALALDLERRLAAHPGIAIYGEVFGKVQDLRYGMGDDVSLVLFDAQDIRTREYLDYDAFVTLAAKLELRTVPVLHRGPWSDSLRDLANGKTVIGGGTHCREGFVARPAKERFDERVGRVILKLHGEDYLLRKSR